MKLFERLIVDLSIVEIAEEIRAAGAG